MFYEEVLQTAIERIAEVTKTSSQKSHLFKAYNTHQFIIREREPFERMYIKGFSAMLSNCFLKMRILGKIR